MEKEYKQQFKEKFKEKEESVVSNPKVIHDGSCEHYWIHIGKDPEGKNEAKCSKCPMGRYFTDEWEVKDGKITNRTTSTDSK